MVADSTQQLSNDEQIKFHVTVSIHAPSTEAHMLPELMYCDCMWSRLGLHLSQSSLFLCYCSRSVTIGNSRLIANKRFAYREVEWWENSLFCFVKREQYYI